MIIMPYGWPWPIDTAHKPGRLLAPHRLFGAASGVRSKPATSASAGRESLSDGGFQAEDRHNPLPHITLSATAPKSVYGKTGPWLFVHLLSCGNFRLWTDRNGHTLGRFDSLSGAAGLPEVYYRAKGSCRPGGMIAGWHAVPLA